MQKLKVGLIGAGQIAGGYEDPKQIHAQRVFTHAGAYRVHGGFELSAVYDLDLERAKLFSEKWSISKVFSGPEELSLFFKEDFDVISVCTPNHTHFDYIKQCLSKSKASVIFAEKPVAENQQQIQQLQDLELSTGKTVFVNYQRSYDSKLKELRQQIEKNELEVLLVRTTYYKGLSHMGSSMLKVILELFGRPQSVICTGSVQALGVSELSYDFSLGYASGLQIVFSCLDRSRRSYNYHSFEFEIHCGDRKIVCHNNSRFLTTFKVSDYEYAGAQIIDELHPLHQKTDYDHALLNAVDTLYKVCFSQGKIRSEDLTHSYQIREIIDAVVESNQSGRRVHLNDR